MNTVWPITVKALNGGLFVVAFALVGEVAAPKRFAGLFSAAPSIALGSLLVTALVTGSADAKQNAQGMIVGAAALGVATVAGLLILRNHRAKFAATGVCTTWLVLAAIGYAAVWR